MRLRVCVCLRAYMRVCVRVRVCACIVCMRTCVCTLSCVRAPVYRGSALNPCVSYRIHLAAEVVSVVTRVYTDNDGPRGPPQSSCEHNKRDLAVGIMSTDLSSTARKRAQFNLLTESCDLFEPLKTVISCRSQLTPITPGE